MAEAILRDLLSQRADAAQWTVCSAGTWGMDGYQAAFRARTALQKSGLSADHHTARTVTRAMLQSSDLILTMEKNHQEALRLEFPQDAQRIFLLSEMLGGRFDIQDPMGGSQVDFDGTLLELRTILVKAMAIITEKAMENAEMRKP